MIFLFFFFCAPTQASSPHAPSPRIIGGQAVTPGVYPEIFWQAEVHVRTSASGTRTCGGVVLSPRFVLTAAFCGAGLPGEVWSPSETDVFLGNIRSPLPNATKPSKVHVHPQWRNGLALKDQIPLAILEFAEALRDAPSANIALPQKDCSDCKGNGVDYIVSGFGSTSESLGTSSQPTTLHWVAQEGVDDKSCKNAAQGSDLWKSSICAKPVTGTTGTAACYGDGGSGLVINRGTESDPRFELAGIVTTGTADTAPF